MAGLSTKRAEPCLKAMHSLLPGPTCPGNRPINTLSHPPDARAGLEAVDQAVLHHAAHGRDARKHACGRWAAVGGQTIP